MSEQQELAPRGAKKPKTIKVTVVRSTTRPGMLSIRVDVNDSSATRLYRAITETFEAGDVLELRLAPRRSDR